MINLISKNPIWLPIAAAAAAMLILTGTAQAQPQGGFLRAQLGNFSLHKVDDRQRSRNRGRAERRYRSEKPKRVEKRRHVEKHRRVERRRHVKRRHRAEKRRYVEHRRSATKRRHVDRRRYIDRRRHITRDRRYRKTHRRVQQARKFDYGHRQRVKKVIVVEPRRRYRNVWVHRRHGHRYRGYGHYHHDDRAYQWLAFTAITLGVLDYMTAAQQRAHESAQITATSAPIGQTIRWNESGLKGNVTATREGTSSSGRYCREFRQAVTVGGKVEETYGTACRQPDGAWEIIP